MITEQVGQLIREARKAKGLTQKELGEKMGISESAVNRYENGSANLSLKTVEKIAEVMGITVRILFE
ncbi:helix-turn-helix domain-containing protein [Spirosoma panaciterrae]|uniref:helix-turn-helix domain-containing protein n=1 Tax=Spirosoma panaciterrae TaxID=496058 RepID=UPI000377DE9F